MAERADQQRRATAPVGIGSAADVPAEPAVRLVAEQLAQDRAAPSGAELDAADPVGGLAAMPGRADGDVVDAVAVEIAGGDDHASEQLARLAPRPVPQLLPGGAGVDAQLARDASASGPRLRAPPPRSRPCRRRRDPRPPPRRRRSRRGDPFPSSGAAPCRSPTRGPRRRPAIAPSASLRVGALRRRDRRARRRRDRRAGRRTIRRTPPSLRGA